MDEKKRILIIDFTNFEDYPIGGYLSFAKNMIKAFNNDLALVGITTQKEDPVGKWFKKEIQGSHYDFFALARYNKKRTKHFIPDRLMCFLLLKFNKSKILQKNFKNVFVQRQEVLPAIKNYGYKNICYRFPGMENPVVISKYWFGRYIADIFDNLFFSGFVNVRLILASGDEEAIQDMIIRSRGAIRRDSVVKFPTRINTDIFKPADKKEARKILNIPLTKTLVVTTGRLTFLKGWKFMIDCFTLFEKSVPDSIFYFIGEGEDHEKIKNYIAINRIDDKITLTGKKNSFEIAKILNASDLFIMGSFEEGWPTSLVEAVGCGVPACVTKFSGAGEIIQEGINGYISSTRDVNEFVQLMLKALKINVNNIEMSQYSISTLKENLLHYWSLL